MTSKKGRSRLWRALLFPFRILALLGLLAVLLALGTAAFLRVMLTQEELVSLVASQLQQALQRPVQIGDVNVMVLQGIRVRGLRVLEAPGFPGSEWLSSEVAVAKYRWAALLDRRLELSEVRLVSPRIQFVRRQDGQWNVAGLLRKRETDRPLALPFPVSLSADEIVIEDGTLTLNDLVRRRLVSVRAFHLRLRDFSPTAPFPFRLSFETDGNLTGKQVALKAEASGSLALASYRWPEAWLEAERIKVTAAGAAATASGSLRNFAAPSVDLKLKLPRLSSESLSVVRPVPPGISIPPISARVKLAVPSTGTILLQSADLSAEPLRLKASGTLKLGDEPSYRLSLTVPTAPLERVGALWSGLARRRLAGTGDLSLSAAGKLGPDQQPVIDRVSIHLKDFSAILSTNVAVSRADAAVRAGKGLDEIEVVAPRGQIVAFGHSLNDVDLVMRFGGGDLDVERLNLGWGPSKFKLKGRIRNFNAPKGFDVEGSVDKLQLQEAIAAVASVVQQIKAARPSQPQPEGRKWSQIFKYAIPKSFPATNGNVRVSELTHPNFHTANVDVKWALRGISTGLDKASGWVRTGFGPGRVSDIPELEKGHKILKVIFLPFVFMHRMNKLAKLSGDTAYPKTLDFNRIYGQYNLQGGVVDIGVFHVDSGQLVAYAEGMVDFPKERVGLHVLTRLTGSNALLPEYLVDENGRVAIGFLVKNDLNTPDLEIELKKMKKTAIEDALQAGLKRQEGLK